MSEAIQSDQWTTEKLQSVDRKQANKFIYLNIYLFIYLFRSTKDEFIIMRKHCTWKIQTKT